MRVKTEYDKSHEVQGVVDYDGNPTTQGTFTVKIGGQKPVEFWHSCQSSYASACTNACWTLHNLLEKMEG